MSKYQVKILENGGKKGKHSPWVNYPEGPGTTFVLTETIERVPPRRRPNGITVSVPIFKESPASYTIKQGYALILHNRHFPKGQLPDRVGSEKDVKAIKEFCQQACLHINDTDRETENLTASEMDSLCDEIAKRSFSRYDGFVCFILSHGNEAGIFGTDDNIISVQEIVSKFKDCNGLAGKPKLFFIQACRGLNKDNGTLIDADNIAPTPSIPLRLPTECDVLVAHSTVEGYVSYRSRASGSWFIHSLIKELYNHAHDMHIMDILTLVNRSVSGYFTLDGMKQMPCQLTTLTKFVYFKYPTPLS